MPNYTQKAVSGVAVTYVFLSLSTIVWLLLRIVLARELPVREFGLFYAVLAFVSMFTFLRDLGMSEAQVKFIPRFISQKAGGALKGLVYFVLSVQAVSGTLFFIGFMLAAPALTQHYFRSPIGFDILVLLGLWFILEGMTESMTYAFNATLNIVQQMSMDFFQAVSVLLITSLLLSRGHGVHSPALGYLLSSAIVAILYWPVLRKKVLSSSFGEKLSLGWGRIKDYLTYSLPLVPASAAIDFFFSNMTVALLTMFTSLEQVALYTAALAASKLLRHVYEPIRNTLFPIASELWETERKDKLSEGIGLLYKYALVMTLPLAGVLVAFPEELLRVLFGEGFVAASPVLQLLAPTMVILTFAVTIEAVFMGVGKSGDAAKQIYVGGVLNIILGLLLIPRFGMVGAAVTLLLAIVGRFAYGMLTLRHTVQVSVPWDAWARTALSSLGFVATILFLKRALELWVGFEVAICLMAGAVVYCLLLFFLRVVTREELTTLFKRVVPSARRD